MGVLPSFFPCVITTLTWERVSASTEGQHGPFVCPPNCLYVPKALRSEVLRLGPCLQTHPSIQVTSKWETSSPNASGGLH